MLIKTCTKCGATKDLDAFGDAMWRPDGFHPQCRACRAAYARAVRAEERAARRAVERANLQKLLGRRITD